MPEPLFVCGVARSGTTAMVETYGAHPRIGLGIERFKRLWRDRMGELDESLFAEARFFDFTDGLTNVVPDASPHWRDYYDRQRAKWAGAAYVGDKMTRVMPRQVWARLPRARMIFVVRDITDVASSWDARAADSGDTTWPSTLDGERAVRRWNRALTAVTRAVEAHPDLATAVEYDAFFGDPDAAVLRRTLTWLGLDLTDETAAAFAEQHQRYVTSIRSKTRATSDHTRALVAAQTDPAAWRRLLELSSGSRRVAPS